MHDLLPVGCLIVVLDQSYNAGVIGELDYGVCEVDRGAVIGEKGIE